MLRTAFIGQRNFFNERLCEWLSEYTDLRLIIWTNNLSWAQTKAPDRKARIAQRFLQRVKKKGIASAINEFLYYGLYRTFLNKTERAKVKACVDILKVKPQKPISEISQIMTDDIRSQKLVDRLAAEQIDAAFAMCIDVFLPTKLINQPRYGSFLWHEGITPEYRGVYSPFWALVNKDHKNLGYTLLKMTTKLDAGDIYVQGRVKGVDLLNDWHSYIGHKAIIDSLPRARRFLEKLGLNQHKPIKRENAQDGYYSYPTASALTKLFFYRFFAKIKGER